MSVTMSALDFEQVIKSSYDEINSALKVRGISEGFVNFPYDSIALTYVAAGNGVGQIQTATYSNSGTPIAVLTLTYDASNRLSTVSKS